MKIIHLSDPHIGHGGKAEKAKQLLDIIRKKYKDESPEPVVIITGDIVHTGAIENYDRARRVFKDYRGEEGFLCCPGNHDFKSRGLLPFPDSTRLQLFREYLGQEVIYPTERKIADCHFLGLNSMEGELDVPDIFRADGNLGRDQLMALNAKIEMIREEAPEDKIIVYLHHHPFYYNFFKRLNDADELKEVIGVIEKGKPKRVNILLFGHKHDEKRFEKKETKYGIDVILASKQNNEIEIGIKKGTKNKPVFCYNEIDTDTYEVTPVEVKVPS
ncbi:MAG: metallophosphoesterase [bacterium]|nr:metallophosphoesterase [bacterium]